MAVSRQTKSVAEIPGIPKRYSFAKIEEPIPLPGLLDVQLDSFAWLVGTPEWHAKQQEERGEDAVIKSGLEDILEELSPIQDYSGNMSLSLSEPRFEPVKYTIDECKDKDINYSAQLYVTAEFINNETQEIKSQTVFIGDFPLMTDKGTFIVNGTERVIVSQLVRSPGVYFDQSIDKSTERPLHSVKIIPSRGAWLEFDVDKRDTVGVRIDRKRRQPVTVLLKALGWTEEQIKERFGFSELIMSTLESDGVANTDEALLEIYRKQRPGEQPTRDLAQALIDNAFFRPKRYDLARVGRYKVNRKLGLGGDHDGLMTLTEEDIATTIEYLVRLHAGESEMTDDEQLYLFHTATRDLQVDQQTGLVVGVDEKVDQYYATDAGERREDYLTFEGATDEQQTAGIVEELNQTADAAAQQLWRWGSVILGALLALVGVVMAVIAGRRR